MSVEPQTQGVARRVIGPWAATAIVAGSMLGVGIVIVPRVVAEQVTSPALFMAVWLAGGLVALAGAVAYAELGAMMPRAGGDYVYLREAFGASTSFAGGWLLFAGVFTGSLATMSVATCQYQLPVLLEPLGDLDLSRVVVELPVLGALDGTRVAALGLLWLLTGVNLAGARPAARAQLATTVVPIVALALLAAGALLTAPHATAQPVLTAPSATTAGGLATAFLAVYFAYAGWNAVAYVAGEVTEPGRNVPKSLLAGTAGVTALYLLLGAAFLSVLGLGGLTGAFEAGTATAVALLGETARWWVCAVLTIALIGSLNGTVLGGARIGYAMGRDGALPRVIGRLSRGTGVPARALVVQALVASVLIATGTFEQLVSLTSLAMLVLGSLVIGALVQLRRQRPEADRPYRASAYPWLPGLYLVVSLAALTISVVAALSGSETRGPTLDDLFPVLGIGAFLLLLIGHWCWRKRPRD